MWCADGPGFVLSRGAVLTLLDNWSFKDSRKFDIQMLSRLVELPGVRALDGLDEEGGQLFNVYGPARSFHGRYDNWYRSFKANVPEDVKEGLACCARLPVSFHYASSREILALYDVLNRRERWARMSREERQAAWPSRRELLGHSKALGLDDPAWELLLEKFRVHEQTSSVLL